MTQAKVRVYELARELNLQSKDLLELCRAHGIDVKNQLSSIEPEMRDQIEATVKRGGGSSPTPAKSTAAVLPSTHKPVRQLDTRPRTLDAHRAPPARPAAEAATPVTPVAPAVGQPPKAPTPPPAPALAVEVPSPPASAVLTTATPPVQVPQPQAPTPVAATPPAPTPTPAAAPSIAVSPDVTPPRAAAPVQAPPAVAASLPPTEPTPPAPPRETPPAATPPSAPTRMPSAGPPRDLRNLDTPSRGDSGRSRTPRPMRPQQIVHRTGNPPASLKPKPPSTTLAKKPGEQPGAQKPIFRFSAEQLQEARQGPIKPEDLLKPPTTPEAAPAVGEDEGDDKKGGKKKPAPGGVVGRDTRQTERNKRAKARKERAGTDVTAKVIAGKAVILEEDRPRHRKLRPKMKVRPGTVQRKGKIVIELPITVRALSEAIGVKSGELLFKLMNQGVTPLPNINSIVDAQAAELLALEYGADLDIRRPADTEETVLGILDKPDPPESLKPRAPIVTIMGHVDHGKTSLLDKIRADYGIKSDVVSTEAGGITQVIRAWRVEKDGKPVTFLDTPGHEAFTKMRARGAQVTDIAVIVVAAEDGVMPQTEEAISHAKAAAVSLVVAINKVDLPNANVNRTRQQLYGLNVLPDNMGGDTPFIETSAVTGKGIEELLEQLAIVAELKELKSNPDKPGRGTCLEAMLSEGEGVLATLLVRQGTLRRGDVIVCGPAFGRVRQMYNDMGQAVEEAGPSVPVRITGLDEVPDADDAFQVVPDLASARTISLKRKARKVEAGLVRRSPLTLDQLTEAKIAELKVILKADFRGSIEAIRKELEKLQHEEVRVRILEAATGGITENDVWLALASPQDTLIVGFNAVPDDRARALAEEKAIKILQYDIIYNLTKDIRAALEGKLKPREEVVHLGRALVRDTFKISRVGTIAGCHVTQGTIKRSGKIRLIREGVVIYPPSDRTAGLESLKRFKEDVGEVREGFECGIKIAGYDDVKVGDVIEAYRVDEVKRTL